MCLQFNPLNNLQVEVTWRGLLFLYFTKETEGQRIEVLATDPQRESVRQYSHSGPPDSEPLLPLQGHRHSCTDLIGNVLQAAQLSRYF